MAGTKLFKGIRLHYLEAENIQNANELQLASVWSPHLCYGSRPFRSAVGLVDFGYEPIEELRIGILNESEDAVHGLLRRKWDTEQPKVIRRKASGQRMIRKKVESFLNKRKGTINGSRYRFLHR